MPMTSLMDAQGRIERHSYSNPTTGGELGVGTWNMQLWGRARLATESLGNTTLSISGVKDGSEITLLDSSGAVIQNVASSSGVPSLTVPYFAAGNPGNTIRILIINLQYEVIDFNYTVSGLSATIPVFQRIDRTYRNPT